MKGRERTSERDAEQNTTDNKYHRSFGFRERALVCMLESVCVCIFITFLSAPDVYLRLIHPNHQLGIFEMVWCSTV